MERMFGLTHVVAVGDNQRLYALVCMRRTWPAVAGFFTASSCVCYQAAQYRLTVESDTPKCAAVLLIEALLCIFHALTAATSALTGRPRLVAPLCVLPVALRVVFASARPVAVRSLIRWRSMSATWDSTATINSPTPGAIWPRPRTSTVTSFDLSVTTNRFRINLPWPIRCLLELMGMIHYDTKY